MSESPVAVGGQKEEQILALSEAAADRRIVTFASIASLPSNVDAIEAALLFATGHINHLALVGPSGWGKTHLLDAVAARMSQDSSQCVSRLELNKYLANPSRHESSAAVILDDVQEVLGKTKLRQALRFQLERRVRAAKPTLLAFTSPKVTRQLKILLPVSREWSIASVETPSSDERVQLLSQMAMAEGLALSPRLTEIIAHHMHGNGMTLSGALKRLRLSSAVWIDAPATLRACGMLNPFFADNPSWDLKLKILRTAKVHATRFPMVSSFEMALYTMLNEATLPESEVARIAEIEPAEAYGKAVRFRKKMEASSTVGNYVTQFMELVVQSIGD